MALPGYTICKDPQGSEEWKQTRKSLKATASKFGTIYRYMRGKCPKSWIEEPSTTNYAMQMGTMCEPKVRKWFEGCKLWEKGWEMKEVGIAIPDFDPRIGASVDGLIMNDGIPVAIIEIKCPVRMYPALTWEKTTLRERITIGHFSQMQGGMA